jgi:hypothetical protein
MNIAWWGFIWAQSFYFPVLCWLITLLWANESWELVQRTWSHTISGGLWVPNLHFKVRLLMTDLLSTESQTLIIEPSPKRVTCWRPRPWVMEGIHCPALLNRTTQSTNLVLSSQKYKFHAIPKPRKQTLGSHRTAIVPPMTKDTLSKIVTM